MFRLLKLMAYGLLGYALYEFVRGAMGTEISRAWDQVAEGARQASSGGGGGRRKGGAQGLSATPDHAERVNMTGSGEGTTESTADVDGGSVRHKVGRGVV